MNYAMCLILFAVNPTPGCHLVVAANRDEQHARATQRADFWSDVPNLLGGRDLVAGGTWLGVTTSGRFAAVTNFAETPAEPVPPLSRGALTANFLESNIDCVTYLKSVQTKADQFRGFNLLISDGIEVYYYSNRNALDQQDSIQKLPPGFYGLSNQLLDCDWSKVGAGRRQLEQQTNIYLKSEHLTKEQGGTKREALKTQLFEMLRDQGDETPHSAKFILGDTYGTSVSTVLIQMRADGINQEIETTDFEERAFDPTGNRINTSAHQLHIQSQLQESGRSTH
jgi:uncharacterized protein with NRDE domain